MNRASPFPLLLLSLLLALAALPGCLPAQSTPARTPAAPALSRPAPTTAAALAPTRQHPTPALPSPGLPVHPSPTPTGCVPARGRLEAHTLPGGVVALPQPLAFTLYLPPCHDLTTGHAYPVLVLLHGLGYNQDQWDRLGAVDLADQWIAAGQAPPFVMAFPENPGYRQPTEDRFAEALVTDLLPWLEQHAAVSADPARRALGGLSRGGGWALHIARAYPGVFGRIGAHSPALFYTDAPLVEPWLSRAAAETFPQLWIDTGRSDPERDAAAEFAGLLDQYHLPHRWSLFNGYHDEAYWSAHLEEYLRFYTEDW